MKALILLVGCMMLADGLPKGGVRADWVGVWRAQLDGQPSATLTLADDSGKLGGTLVLDIIARDSGTARVVAQEPHVLLHVRADGKTLTFEAKRPDRSASPMTFTVTLGADDTARIHCLNCGDAPVVELVKVTYGK